MGRMSFQTKALLGYFVLVVVLVLGMTVSVRQLSTAADAQIARLRVAERQITLVERLRWRSEVIVSDGRGYLLSGDPRLLAKLEDSVVEFDANVHALGTRRGPFVADVEQAAGNFRRVQRELVIGRQGSEDAPALVRRFENQLLPLRGSLDLSLTRLVDHEQAALQGFYDTATRNRERLLLGLIVLRGVLLSASLAAAWYFARRLGRSYRQERDAREAASKALAARDEVMGIVAHDLRNPLGTITLNAALLQQTATSERARQQAESIGNVATRMEYLIRTMLDVTTMEAGKFTVSPAACTAHGLLHETETMFEPLATSKQIRLEVTECAPDLAVDAERERILQVLSNLVGNALKFTARGGRVTLSAAREGATVRFAVVDTGPGIPRENLSRVFDRFWKKDSPGKKGTGLGLFIAKGIVEAHRGRIWVESDPGDGAKFYFTLPLVELSRTER